MKERILTAVIAIILFIPIVIYGDWVFNLTVYLLATIAFIELTKMKKIPLVSFPNLFSILLLWITINEHSAFQLTDTFSLTKIEILMFGVIVLMAYTVLIKNKFNFDDVGFLIVSVIYLGMGFYFLMEIRGGDDIAGLKNLIYVLLVIWATDTGAYFIGRAMGKRKLWPDISPKKTVEGSIGGIVLACIVAIVYQLLADFHAASLVTIVIVTVILSIVGQIGDLVESAIKRIYHVKDSGNILPGHGGILDRFDSLIFMLPVLHLMPF
jgi:phosphatidate cytidylyltransferase